MCEGVYVDVISLGTYVSAALMIFTIGQESKTVFLLLLERPEVAHKMPRELARLNPRVSISCLVFSLSVSLFSHLAGWWGVCMQPQPGYSNHVE